MSDVEEMGKEMNQKSRDRIRWPKPSVCVMCKGIGIYHEPGKGPRPCLKCYERESAMKGTLMRDLRRINPMIEVLREYWLSHPDLRLGQILCNMIPGRGERGGAPDPFYVEDDVVFKSLREAVGKTIADEEACPPGCSHDHPTKKGRP